MNLKCNLRISPKDAADLEIVKQKCAESLKINRKNISAVVINRKSIDTRRRDVVIDMALTVYVGEEKPELYKETVYQNVFGKKKVIVVGSGPAGLFAALRLIEKGFCPVVIERGEDVHKRKYSMAAITQMRVVNEDSNYSFGEGGAGAFSDGKLYTRSNKRGDVQSILTQFCQHGASLDILSDAHPHIGSDKLPSVIENIRKTIITHGGEFYFETKVTELVFSGDKVIGVRTNKGGEFFGPVILAIGHSARDFFRYLATTSVVLEAKGIAVGVRLEHPQHLIDQIQYKNVNGKGKYLPSATYSFVTQAQQRGVYSFCMCPGGFIVPAMTSPEQVVVNGMSNSKRNGRFANSAMVVELRSEDVDGDDTLKIMRYQEALEKKCFIKGGASLTAPGQRMEDFVKGRISSSLPDTTFALGVKSVDLSAVLPPFVSSRLKEAFQTFGRQARGFLTQDALMIATESRTSSPIKIVRNKESLMAINNEGLFPSGEGAGYAGGIVSAALDGVNCADSVIKYLEEL